jgi:hypothetical protein
LKEMVRALGLSSCVVVAAWASLFSMVAVLEVWGVRRGRAPAG